MDSRLLIGAFAIAGISMVACDSHDEPYEVVLPIQEQFVIASEWVDRDDAEKAALCKGLNGKLFVVNSADELPDDIFGFGKTFTSHDFKSSTILIYYDLHFWELEAYGYRYTRDNVEKRYEWGISNVTDTEGLSTDRAQLSRYAVSVGKLPPGAEVTVWFSLKNISWNWDE